LRVASVEGAFEEGVRNVDRQILALLFERLQCVFQLVFAEPEQFADLAHDALRVRIVADHHAARAWRRMFGQAEAHRRYLQCREALADDGGDNFAADAIAYEAGICGHEPAGLSHRCEDGRRIEWPKHTQIDNLRGTADFLQDVSGAHRFQHGVRRGDDGHVLAGPYHTRPIERILVVALWHVPRGVVHKPMLEEDHRVVILDSCNQHAFGISSEGGHHDLEAGEVGE